MINELEQSALVEKEPVKNYLFEQAIFMFTDDERGEAQRYLDIYKEFETAFLKDSSLYSALVNRMKRLEDELGYEGMGHYKLYHLLTASTLSEENWKKYPMDTPQGHYRNFIENELVPILEEQEAA